MDYSFWKWYKSIFGKNWENRKSQKYKNIKIEDSKNTSYSFITKIISKNDYVRYN